MTSTHKKVLGNWLVQGKLVQGLWRGQFLSVPVQGTYILEPVGTREQGATMSKAEGGSGK